MTDLYSAYAEDWKVENATFEQLVETFRLQDFFLVIFKLEREK